MSDGKDSEEEEEGLCLDKKRSKALTIITSGTGTDIGLERILKARRTAKKQKKLKSQSSFAKIETTTITTPDGAVSQRKVSQSRQEAGDTMLQATQHWRFDGRFGGGSSRSEDAN
jgi:hypothetical protein